MQKNSLLPSDLETFVQVLPSHCTKWEVRSDVGPGICGKIQRNLENHHPKKMVEESISS